jgi:hypothetical protein
LVQESRESVAYRAGFIFSGEVSPTPAMAPPRLAPFSGGSAAASLPSFNRGRRFKIRRPQTLGTGSADEFANQPLAF